MKTVLLLLCVINSVYANDSAFIFSCHTKRLTVKQQCLCIIVNQIDIHGTMSFKDIQNLNCEGVNNEHIKLI